MNALVIPHDPQSDFQQFLNAHRNWMSHLGDQAAPTLGRDFIDATSRLGLKESLALAPDDHIGGMAAFWAFDIRQPSYFLNRITYEPEYVGEPDVFLDSRAHEMTHGLQYQVAPVCHANPYNRATQIILDPEDFLSMVERAEEDATLHAHRLRAVWTHEPVKAIIPSDAERRASLSGSDREFQHGAWMNCWRNFIEQAHRPSLDMYTVCRAEPADLWQIGQSFGDNVFGRTPHLGVTVHGALSAETQRSIESLRDAFGYRDRAELPTFREALRAHGQTPEQFLALSLAGPAPVFP